MPPSRTSRLISLTAIVLLSLSVPAAWTQRALRRQLSAGADRSLKNSSWRTAWRIAYEEGFPAAARLLETGNERRQAFLDAGLISAVAKGELNRVRTLLDRGAGPNTRNRAGIPPLMIAAANGSSPIVSCLLAKGANVNLRGRSGWTALMEAASPYRGHLPIVRALIAHGAEVDAVDNSGETALSQAAQGEDVAIVAALADAGADLNGKGAFAPPLWWAATHGHAEVVRLLLARGANVRARNRDGETAWERATQEGLSGIAALLAAAEQTR